MTVHWRKEAPYMSSADSSSPARIRTGMGKIELRRAVPSALDTSASNSARYVGRIGALAVALGVGAALASVPAVAYADTTGSGGSTGSSEDSVNKTPRTKAQPSRSGQRSGPSGADTSPTGRGPRGDTSSQGTAAPRGRTQDADKAAPTAIADTDDSSNPAPPVPSATRTTPRGVPSAAPSEQSAGITDAVAPEISSPAPRFSFSFAN